MDSAEYLQPHKRAEQPYYIEVIEDGESIQMPPKGMKSDKTYVSPNVYAEIQDAHYESLKVQRGDHDQAPASRPESNMAQPVKQEPPSCSGKSPRFWCLLTAALTSVIITLLVILPTVIILFTRGGLNTAGASTTATTLENGGKTTSSSHGPETSKLPHTPETRKAPEPLNNATFLMNCERLRYTRIYGLCWMDEGTLIVASHDSQRVLKYMVNTEAKSCRVEVIDSGFTPFSASCSADGSVYITEEQYRREVKIKIYDVQNNSSQTWYPGFDTNSTYMHIAVNDQFIVISSGRDNYVYNKDRVLQYKIHHTEVRYHFIYTYLTTDDVFFGTVDEGNKLLSLNLLTNDTYISNDGVKRAYTVTGTRFGHVFVTSLITAGGRDVGMYSLNGTFLNYIQIELPRVDWYTSAAVRNNDGKTFIAYSGYNDSPIPIYYIHYGVDRYLTNH